MKSELREKRNALIRTEVHELIKQGMNSMDAYHQVGEKYFMSETTVRFICNIYGYYR